MIWKFGGGEPGGERREGWEGEEGHPKSDKLCKFTVRHSVLFLKEGRQDCQSVSRHDVYRHWEQMKPDPSSETPLQEQLEARRQYRSCLVWQAQASGACCFAAWLRWWKLGKLGKGLGKY